VKAPKLSDLAEMKAKGERAQRETNLRKGPKSRAATSEPKLSDLGVSKTQSSRWQKLARLHRNQCRLIPIRVAGVNNQTPEA
jgi:hypothetical protein